MTRRFLMAAAVLLPCMVAGESQSAVTYRFIDFGSGVLGTIFDGTITLPDYITADVTLLPADFDVVAINQGYSGSPITSIAIDLASTSSLCNPGVAPPCDLVRFIVPSGFDRYGFALGTFSVDGTHNAVTGIYSGRMIITSVPTEVPEPASFALLGLGILGLVASARRRRT